jgi:hypothetical protein
MSNASEPKQPGPLEGPQLMALLEQTARKGMRTFRWLIGGQSLVMLCLVGAVVYLLGQSATTNTQTQQALAQTRQGAISSCISGNAARATNKLIWDSFLSLLVTNPGTAKEKAALEAMVANAGLPQAEVQVFDALLNAQYTVSPNTSKIVSQFEAYIALHEPAQNCAKIYSY